MSGTRMIVITITMNAHPSKRNELLQTLQGLLELLPEEKGYLNAQLEMDWDNNAFTLVEEWNTRKDVDRYMQSKYFSVLRGAMKLLTSSATITMLPNIHPKHDTASSRQKVSLPPQ